MDQQLDSAEMAYKLRLAKDYPHDINLFDQAANMIESLRAQLDAKDTVNNLYSATADIISMDKDEAIRRMQIAEAALSALRAQQKICRCQCGEQDDSFCETCNRIRVQAIKEKLVRENPEPLTLEQLKERVGKPVYMVHNAGGRHWDVLEKVLETISHGKTGVELFWRGGTGFGESYHPECTQYFDHEPKEATNA